VAPPLVALAVKVTACPAHVGLLPEVKEVETAGVTLGLMVTVVLFDVAVDGLAHPRFEVRIQVTTAPLVNELEEKVLPVPAFVPFTCH